MNAILIQLGSFLAAHETLLTAGISALFVAAVCTMPAKAPLIPADHPIQDVWTWIRDTLQTAVPAARMNHANGQNQNPLRPADPANQK